MKRVLVFDDDEQVLRLLVHVFLAKGWEVHSFCDARSFCGALSSPCQCADGQSCSDLLLTDLRMPGRSGLEMIRALEQKSCRIRQGAIMSGQWNSSDKEEARRLGYRVFDKPVKLADIEAWLHECEKRLEGSRVLVNCFQQG